jgi:tetratricopeptide (TPR) repeat protein
MWFLEKQEDMLAEDSQQQLRLVATNLNNLGVSLIQTGQLGHAIACFAKALEHLRKFPGQGEAKKNDTEPGKASIDQCMVQSSSSPCDTVDAKHDQVPFLYRHAIHINTCSSPNNHMDAMMISVIIIFNLGLVHQLLGMQADAISSAVVLQKAGVFYQLAFKLLLLEDKVDSITSNLLFGMAVANNLAIIHISLGKIDAAGKFFEHLLSMLMVFTTACSSNACHLSAELRATFFRNASDLLRQHNSAAAAAAAAAA